MNVFRKLGCCSGDQHSAISGRCGESRRLSLRAAMFGMYPIFLAASSMSFCFSFEMRALPALPLSTYETALAETPTAFAIS